MHRDNGGVRWPARQQTAAAEKTKIKPTFRHAITAAPDSALEFYAVSTPAFSPDDYVPVKEMPPGH